MTPPNHNGYTGLGVDRRSVSDRAKLEEAIRAANTAPPYHPLDCTFIVGRGALNVLTAAAEAHLATLPKPPRKEPRTLYAVYTGAGVFCSAHEAFSEAQSTNKYLCGSRLVVLSGEIELP